MRTWDLIYAARHRTQTYPPPSNNTTNPRRSSP